MIRRIEEDERFSSPHWAKSVADLRATGSEVFISDGVTAIFVGSGHVAIREVVEESKDSWQMSGPEIVVEVQVPGWN